MLIVHGSGGGEAVMGEMPATLCEACGKMAPRTGVVRFRYWHLWYLFSFLTGREYQTVCQACGAVTPMDKADAKINFPKDNIPFIRKRGWALCIGILLCILVVGAVSSSMDGERLRAMLETPAVGDLYHADLSKIPGSGYRLGGGAMYGGMLLVEKLDDGRFVVATSDTAFERKSDLRKQMKADLEYSVSYNDEEEPLTLSQKELADLLNVGILYDGERKDIGEFDGEQEENAPAGEADAETVAAAG